MTMNDTALPRVQRVRHELKKRALQVLRVERVSPLFQRITLTDESLGDFVSAAFDDHVKILLPDGVGETLMREYTPRAFDTTAHTLVLDFALHGEGPAAAWAAQAQPGQTLTVAGPRGSFVVAEDFDWHLLIGDETALPAIARRLEELPAGRRAIVRLALADPADRALLPPTAATLDLAWVDRPEALVDAARALRLPAGEGYAWCATEASVAAALRDVLVDEKGHAPKLIRSAAYWKRGAAAHG